MKCLPVNARVDVCVSVDVKLIYRQPASGDLREEVVRREARLKASYAGTCHEAQIAEAVRAALVDEELGAG
ncbi:MAG: hypothetical protein MUD16_14305 [Desulfobacterales bacterium]|jgi:hypothetical protein|nr:hypothetical protein [Desulfobacterales bacterium]